MVVFEWGIREGIHLVHFLIMSVTVEKVVPSWQSGDTTRLKTLLFNAKVLVSTLCLCPCKKSLRQSRQSGDTTRFKTLLFNAKVLR